MDTLSALANSALAQWLSVSMLGVPTLMGLHSIGMAIVVGLSLMLTLRLFGVFIGFRAGLIPRLLGIALWGFLLNFVTGLGIFVSRADDYVQSGLFIFKMILVLLSALILFELKRRLYVAEEGASAAVVDRTSQAMSLLATMLLIAAVVAGRLLAYLSNLY